MAHVLGGNRGNTLPLWPLALPVLEEMPGDLEVTRVRGERTESGFKPQATVCNTIDGWLELSSQTVQEGGECRAVSRGGYPNSSGRPVNSGATWSE